MALGTSRPRNWGKESQQIALEILMKRRNVAFKVVKGVLFLTPSKNGISLPFIESVASMVNTRRGRWESRHPFDDRVLATGVSERDVIRKTIQAVWQ